MRKPHTRIRKYGFIAEIIVGTHEDHEVFHCIIQREGSPEVLSWGQQRSLKEALDCAEAELLRCSQDTTQRA
jgi:hypothetical protein